MTDRLFAGRPSHIVQQWRAMLEPGPLGDLPGIKAGASIAPPCGSCTLCCRSAMRVKLTEQEAQSLPHEVHDGQLYLQHRGRDCVMFDAQQNRCSIYEDRPAACRTYDCRPLWLAGFRNTARGVEMNARLDAWRAQVWGDLDIGIITTVWIVARELLQEHGDVGLSSSAAMIVAAQMTDKELTRVGRHARKSGVQHIINLLNKNKPDAK